MARERKLLITQYKYRRYSTHLLGGFFRVVCLFHTVLPPQLNVQTVQYNKRESLGQL